MGRQELEELAGIMQRLADGDERAVLDLHQRFGGYIAGAIRAALRRRGWSLVKDDVDGLVLDACLAIEEAAHGWSPDGGALPWVWGRRRIENCVDRLIGQHTVPLDDQVVTSPEAVVTWTTDGGDGRGDDCNGLGDRPMSSAFAALMEVDARCRMIDEAFEQVAVSRFDKELLLQYVAEQCGGNRSPAATVGVTFALAPATVRQRVHRVRRRLRQLASSNGRFTWLGPLPLLGPTSAFQTPQTNGRHPSGAASGGGFPGPESRRAQ